MPELPEVETTRRALDGLIVGAKVVDMRIRNASLRWPISELFPERICGQTVSSIARRAKYLLFPFEGGAAIIHLGMSGSLRVVSANEPVTKHDHFDWVLSNDRCLRYNDPRRFGCLLWAEGDPLSHRLLNKLGPEPLDDGFNSAYLYSKCQAHRVPIKSLLMNGHMVVGVGNIYANEALFRSGIHPKRLANGIGKPRVEQLCQEIKNVLLEAIRAGGSTLKDFSSADGKPGYFQQQLFVYGRKGLPCKRCGVEIKQIVLNQRASYYCGGCQR